MSAITVAPTLAVVLACCRSRRLVAGCARYLLSAFSGRAGFSDCVALLPIAPVLAVTPACFRLRRLAAPASAQPIAPAFDS